MAAVAVMNHFQDHSGLVRACNAAVSAAAAAFLLLTSAYALLAFLPYTFYALVKAPPYEWLAWFTKHHAAAYWMISAGVLAIFFQRPRNAAFWVWSAITLLTGIFLSWNPLAEIRNDHSALWISFVALAPVWGLVAIQLARLRSTGGRDLNQSLPFLPAVAASLAVAVAYGLASAIPVRSDWHPLLLFWSGLCHALVAVVCVATLNLARKIAQRTQSPAGAFLVAVWVLITAVLWHALWSFFAAALSFEGPLAVAYSGVFASTVAALLIGLCMLALPRPETRQGYLLLALAVLAFMVVRFQPAENDWNSVLEGLGTAVSWVALAAALYCIRPAKREYNIPVLLAAVVLAGATYAGLYSTRILWGSALGETDQDISRRFERYAADHSSFRLTQLWLGESLGRRCGELCRILRRHTNIRDNVGVPQIDLVERFAPAQAPPNIFIIVVDSLRPDYLGAYNPKVDFTPHLDEFARGSVVIPNAITPYTGTTLAEPAIWAGMQLLHTHYPQPFARVNNLEKLLQAHGYDMYVSMDTVLRELLTPSPQLIPLDADKTVWNRFEGCSTFAELRRRLEQRRSGRPIFFYAQPMNVHQFARNDLPLVGDSDWSRPGFSRRISFQLNQLDRCFGELISFLKRERLFDNSIVIVTSDHGEGTPELGRSSHSLSIYPEMLRVPILVRLPASLHKRYQPAPAGLSSLTDITPSLYYLLGNHGLQQHPLIGRSLFVAAGEPPPMARTRMLVASDVRAVYGVLEASGQRLYVVYDSPERSYLFDLVSDPDGTRNIVTESQSRYYNRQIVTELQQIAEFYGYRPRLFHSNPETGGAPLRAAP